MSEPVDDTATCGRGLAAHAEIPEAVGRWIGALADNLELHLTTLPPDDPAALAEIAVYRAIVHEQRRIARDLAATAQRMADARTLPAAPHDEQAFGDPRLLAAFERFVAAQADVLARLGEAHARDDAMLGSWKGEVSGR